MKGEWFLVAGGIIALYVYQHHQMKKDDEASDERAKLDEDYNSELWESEESEENKGKRSATQKHKRKILYRIKLSIWITFSIILAIIGDNVIGVDEDNNIYIALFIFFSIALCFIDNAIRGLGRSIDASIIKIEVLRRQLNSVHRAAVFSDETWTDRDREEISEKKRKNFWTVRPGGQ